jgi:hypothetical protein
LAGGHNYLIMDGKGNGANVEAMATRSHTEALADEALAHTNHCLHDSTRAVERRRDADSQRDSEARLADASRLLDRSGLTITDLQAVTADTASICHAGQAPRFVGTCGGMIMRPGTRELWVVAGRPSQGAYQRYVVGEAVAAGRA